MRLLPDGPHSVLDTAGLGKVPAAKEMPFVDWVVALPGAALGARVAPSLAGLRLLLRAAPSTEVLGYLPLRLRRALVH